MANQKGQITIFFSTTILMLLTFLAFIINIGVFVKAKINLQNATDAAAYAGASVQARQLTNIAYLNWEMRNVYKEWMFKYYVLGGLGLNDVSSGPSGATVNFRMESFSTNNSPNKDSYNFPSVCIDFAGASSVGICTKYVTPGLPRIDPQNVIGIDEATNAFVDTLSAEKAKDCSERSRINFLANSVWAYNVIGSDDTGNTFADIAPEIGINRSGAFPKAFELALRIRNLESQVNKRPNQRGVCSQQSQGVNCVTEISSLLQNQPSPSQERIYKAFFSGFRNLGGREDTQMKTSFTLTEIPPQPFTDEATNSLSTLLIPSSAPEAKTKFYLDLKLMPINIATFYTAFNSTSEENAFLQNAIQANADAQCTATKIGLPIPGYPLGFIKNPDVLTYYAVRGQTKFFGLFNPFLEEITLTTFSAAKPFGGRIGPPLFDVTRDSNRVFPRPAPSIKSGGYISSLDTTNLRRPDGSSIAEGEYAAGTPLPINFSDNQFWIKDSTGAIGGFITGQEIFFGIPNLVYDYPIPDAIFQKDSYLADNGLEIQQIIPEPVGSTDPLPGTEPRAGLYNNQIYEKLRTKLRNIGGTVTVDDINDGFLISKSATLYDFANYLVPSPEDLNREQEIDSFGAIGGVSDRTIQDAQGDNYKLYPLQLYGPIFATSTADSIYPDSGVAISVLDEYLNNQEQALEKYISSLNLVADAIFDSNISSSTGQNLGEEAAKTISDLDNATFRTGTEEQVREGKPTCNSIAGKFAIFYNDDTELATTDGPCLKSLRESLREFFTNGGEVLGEYYQSEYTIKEDLESRIFTGYRPGQNHDSVRNDGTVTNVFSNRREKMFRNYYSTKFIPLNSLQGSGFYSASGGSSRAILSEGSQTAGPGAQRQRFANPLNIQAIGETLENIQF